MVYSEKVMDHFTNPRNVGEIPDADGVGEVGNAKCGDIMKMYLKIENNIITDVKFKTFGCGAAIASSSISTEMVKGKTIEEALKLTIDEVLKFNVITVQKIDLPDDYSWDFQLKELKYHNVIVELTNKEKIFLELLFSHKNRVFKYDEIFDYVWEFDETLTINGLKNIVKRLRKKLPENTILNIFNEGYKISY